MSVINSIMSAIANGITNGLISLFQLIVSGIQDGIEEILHGFGLMIENPLNTWAYAVANNNGIAIPVVFVVILGISVFVVLLIVDIYGIENDIDRGIGGLMEL